METEQAINTLADAMGFIETEEECRYDDGEAVELNFDEEVETWN